MGLGPLGPLLDRLRTQALSIERRPSRGGQTRSRATDPRDGRSASELEMLVTKLAAIPQDAPDRRRRAFRLFLQATLARELGWKDSNSPGCQALVDQVMEAMEQQESLRTAIEKAADLLLSEHDALR